MYMSPFRIVITKILVLVMTMFFFLNASAQNITIIGQAYDKETKLPLPRLMIINKRTSNGVFADSEGKFTIRALQSDTIMLSALGFNSC